MQRRSFLLHAPALAALAVALLGAGCAVGPYVVATPDVDDYLYDVPTAHPRKVVCWQDMRWGGVVRQGLDYSCGTAALATLMNSGFDDNAVESQILSDIISVQDDEGKGRILEKGVSMLDLKRAAIRRGYLAEGATLPLSSLRQLRGAVVVHLLRDGKGHFSVLRGIVDDQVQLADPGEGNVRLSLDQFAYEWSGFILALARPGGTVASVNGLRPNIESRSLDEVCPGRRDRGELPAAGLLPDVTFSVVPQQVATVAAATRPSSSAGPRLPQPPQRPPAPPKPKPPKLP
jgi:predicted double-glycine peptidase